MKTMKGLLGLAVVCCLFGLLEGCAKKVPPLAVTPEPQVEEVTQPAEPKEEPVEVTPQAETKESDLDQSFTKNEYPGIEGEFLESSKLQDVHFAFDRSDLSAESCKVLKENADLLKQYPQANVQIEGHCDERGSTSYNLALGERRAVSVRDYLVSLGVQSARLSTISYGEEMPIDSGHDEEAWAKNRRAHMIILEK
ncbi:MAG: peptidoglycan-associated lipoprotein Pal [bacterium]